MSLWIAVVHTLAAAGWVVMLWVAILARNPLGWTIVPGLLYPMSWVLIGAWALRGIPNPQPSTSEA